MLSKLGKMYMDTLPSRAIKEWQIRERLATDCIECVKEGIGSKYANVYTALTHLDQVPLFDINLIRYMPLVTGEDEDLFNEAYGLAVKSISELHKALFADRPVYTPALC